PRLIYCRETKERAPAKRRVRRRGIKISAADSKERIGGALSPFIVHKIFVQRRRFTLKEASNQQIDCCKLRI
ncbi:MAG: hypothetical protein ACI4QC_04910, partial [Thermoguttaceae bacterium]